MDECYGKCSRWRGSRSQLHPRDGRHLGRSNFVQVGEHLRGHPRNTSFVSCHLSYGRPQSSLSAAGSVGECLNDNDIDARCHAHVSGHDVCILGSPPDRCGSPPDRTSTHTSGCDMHRHVYSCMLSSLSPFVAQGVLKLSTVGTVAS